MLNFEERRTYTEFHREAQRYTEKHELRDFRDHIHAFVAKK
jgi:hypothetical protein